MRNEDADRVEDPQDSLRDEEFSQHRMECYSDYTSNLDDTEE